MRILAYYCFNEYVGTVKYLDDDRNIRFGVRTLRFSEWQFELTGTVMRRDIDVSFRIGNEIDDNH